MTELIRGGRRGERMYPSCLSQEATRVVLQGDFDARLGWPREPHTKHAGHAVFNGREPVIPLMSTELSALQYPGLLSDLKSASRWPGTVGREMSIRHEGGGSMNSDPPGF